jgi:hypothetical protein
MKEWGEVKNSGSVGCYTASWIPRRNSFCKSTTTTDWNGRTGAMYTIVWRKIVFTLSKIQLHHKGAWWNPSTKNVFLKAYDLQGWVLTHSTF